MSYAVTFRSEVLASLRTTGRVRPVAQSFGVSDATLRAWAAAEGIALADPRERMKRGNEQAQIARYGDTTKRRAKARRMRAKGATLAEIARACGYAGASGARYAISQFKGEENL